MNTSHLPATILQTSPDCEIVSSRVVNFPIETVFRAWTEPQHLQNWWGPAGFTNTFYEFDLRVGGRWRFMMHGPEKGNYPNEVEFITINKPILLAWNRISKPLFQVEASFESVEENKTKIIFKQLFLSAEECNKVKPFAVDKNEENFDRLEMELGKMINKDPV